MAYFRCGAKPEEEKTVTAGTSAIEVLPSSGKVMKKVTVNPTPSETKTVTPKASKQTVSPSSGKLLSKVTVNGDADLVAGNIKSGVNIFGVGGTFDNSEGLYAWKKSSVDCIDNITTQTRKNYTLRNATSDTTVYYSTSYTLDETTGTYTLVNPKSATLQYAQWGVYSVEMVKSNYYIWGSTSSNKIYNTNASSTYNVYIQNDKGSVYLYAQTSFSNYYKYDIHSVKTEYTFLDYIVSDKETAYPDGGEKDGYWYERVVEGMIVTTGTISTNGTAPSSITFDVGITDIKGLVVFDSSSNTTSEAHYFPEKNIAKFRRGNYNWGTLTVTQDGTSVTLSGSNGAWYNSASYYWYAFGY